MAEAENRLEELSSAHEGNGREGGLGGLVGRRGGRWRRKMEGRGRRGKYILLVARQYEIDLISRNLKKIGGCVGAPGERGGEGEA